MLASLSTAPPVTIVVLTHNRAEELCHSLDRLSSLPEHPPIIVVDNGSRDSTSDCVRLRFPGIKLVVSGRNLGAAGRNLGVAQAETPYIAFSDDDTWWAPGSLRLAADLLDRHPFVAALNARIMVEPDSLLDPACAAMADSPLEQVAGVGPMLVGFMAGAVVMRKSAFVQAGGYWEAFHIGGEETLLAMDILATGKLIAYAPALQVHHSPSQARDNALRRRLLARNAIWTAWLRLPGRMAWQQTRRTLALLPAPAQRFQALVDALSGVRAVLAKRRVLSKDVCQLLERVWLHERR